MIGTALPAPYTVANYCQNSQTVATGAHSRGTSPALYIQALMDTLRRQAAPVARLRSHQATIRQWLLVEQPDTAALETYVGTLAKANPEAFFGLGLDLLEQYRRTGRRAAAARLHPVLAAPVAAYPAAEARLALSDVLSRLGNLAPWPDRQVPAADSMVLRRLARTPGGEAEMAALWFNYLYPGAGLQPAVAQPVAVGLKLAPTASQTVVRSLYPNPANDLLHVEISAPKTAKAVTLYLTDLISGRVMLQAAVPGAKNGQYQAEVDVRALPVGQYAARLMIDGVPAAAQKVIINH